MATFNVETTRTKLGLKRWHWNLVADNGEPVATSELYNSRAAALAGAHVVVQLAGNATIVEKNNK